ncbi:undecaprenyl-phosphate alpha-N-acetylglucosaminyl 1-phosphate transferase [Lamprobacter modestohalophilus]|uniref:undecaprenyl-phosphate alpha-N-acetylglucosaminyl 1-phosphate transferase n=1 Tax=Lamprobacter modestohalophilus TaxID=1064514 RepID=UPI002ADEBBAA|nr:undecaprenyl-phosphate alpha-N-acetylglucosaminyl 1-phosphate transferase [Lamprobacter modestohalophilus]MEA1048995.1 undecaprenyl-phosphate alpha-N-acetylglucosaminyl 1-phosphate transferase [Lamprobacter modestohalophilus]
MQNLNIALGAFAAAGTSLTVIYALHPLAPRLGLIDHPGSWRKLHQRAIPTIGGLSIAAGLLAAYMLIAPASEPSGIALLGAALLVVVGGLDDRFNLDYQLRFLAQAAAALILVLGAGVKVTNLGDLLGLGPIHLGAFSLPFSVIAVVGLINAFNMIDGIDGLSGGLALIALVSLCIADPTCSTGGAFLLPIVCAALLPYLACNLGIGRLRQKKIFLGDAGSMLLGYLVAWALISATQPAEAAAVGDTAAASGLAPVIALWLVAIPLLDVFNVMSWRMLRKRSPFKADRSHLHHKLTRVLGHSRVALVVILAIASLFATVALVVWHLGVPEPVLFYAALLVFAGYVLMQTRVPRVYSVRYRRRLQRRLALQTVL